MNFAKLLLAAPVMAGVLSASAAIATPAGLTELKVAFITAASGTDPNTANELKRGVDVFLAANAKAKTRLLISHFDNKGDVLETASLVKKISEEGFTTVVGIARSDEAIAAGQIANARGMLFLTPFATNPKINQLGNNVFQVCYSDEAQGAALAKLAKTKLKPRRLLVLVNSESLYSSGLAAKFLKDISTDKSVLVEEISYTEKDLRTEFIQDFAVKLKPDLVFIPDHINRAAIFAKALNKLLPQVKFLGGDGFGGKKVLTGVFGDTPKIELYYTTHWHTEINTSANKKFVAKYKELFPSSEPTSGAAMMFDLMGVLDSAVQSGRLKPADIAQYIRSNSFSSTTGKLDFAKDLGVGVTKPVVVLRLKDSQYGFLQTIY